MLNSLRDSACYEHRLLQLSLLAVGLLSPATSPDRAELHSLRVHRSFPKLRAVLSSLLAQAVLQSLVAIAKCLVPELRPLQRHHQQRQHLVSTRCLNYPGRVRNSEPKLVLYS